MAKGTQQALYLVLAKAYVDSVKNGTDMVYLHVDWLAEALDYLNPGDTSKTKLTTEELDDKPTEELERLFAKELENA